MSKKPNVTIEDAPASFMDDMISAINDLDLQHASSGEELREAALSGAMGGIAVDERGSGFFGLDDRQLRKAKQPLRQPKARPKTQQKAQQAAGASVGPMGEEDFLQRLDIMSNRMRDLQPRLEAAAEAELIEVGALLEKTELPFDLGQWKRQLNEVSKEASELLMPRDFGLTGLSGEELEQHRKEQNTGHLARVMDGYRQTVVDLVKSAGIDNAEELLRAVWAMHEEEAVAGGAADFLHAQSLRDRMQQIYEEDAEEAEAEIMARMEEEARMSEGKKRTRSDKKEGAEEEPEKGAKKSRGKKADAIRAAARARNNESAAAVRDRREAVNQTLRRAEEAQRAAQQAAAEAEKVEEQADAGVVSAEDVEERSQEAETAAALAKARRDAAVRELQAAQEALKKVAPDDVLALPQLIVSRNLLREPVPTEDTEPPSRRRRTGKRVAFAEAQDMGQPEDRTYKFSSFVARDYATLASSIRSESETDEEYAARLKVLLREGTIVLKQYEMPSQRERDAMQRLSDAWLRRVEPILVARQQIVDANLDPDFHAFLASNEQARRNESAKWEATTVAALAEIARISEEAAKKDAAAIEEAERMEVEEDPRKTSSTAMLLAAGRGEGMRVSAPFGGKVDVVRPASNFASSMLTTFAYLGPLALAAGVTYAMYSGHFPDMFSAVTPAIQATANTVLSYMPDAMVKVMYPMILRAQGIDAYRVLQSTRRYKNVNMSAMSNEAFHNAAAAMSRGGTGESASKWKEAGSAITVPFLRRLAAREQGLGTASAEAEFRNTAANLMFGANYEVNPQGVMMPYRTRGDGKKEYISDMQIVDGLAKMFSGKSDLKLSPQQEQGLFAGAQRMVAQVLIGNNKAVSEDKLADAQIIFDQGNTANMHNFAQFTAGSLAMSRVLSEYALHQAGYFHENDMAALRAGINKHRPSATRLLRYMYQGADYILNSKYAVGAPGTGTEGTTAVENPPPPSEEAQRRLRIEQEKFDEIKLKGLLSQGAEEAKSKDEGEGGADAMDTDGEDEGTSSGKLGDPNAEVFVKDPQSPTYGGGVWGSSAVGTVKSAAGKVWKSPTVSLLANAGFTALQKGGFVPDVISVARMSLSVFQLLSSVLRGAEVYILQQEANLAEITKGTSNRARLAAAVRLLLTLLGRNLDLIVLIALTGITGVGAIGGIGLIMRNAGTLIQLGFAVTQIGVSVMTQVREVFSALYRRNEDGSRFSRVISALWAGAAAPVVTPAMLAKYNSIQEEMHGFEIEKAREECVASQQRMQERLDDIKRQEAMGLTATPKAPVLDAEPVMKPRTMEESDEAFLQRQALHTAQVEAVKARNERRLTEYRMALELVTKNETERMQALREIENEMQCRVPAPYKPVTMEDVLEKQEENIKVIEGVKYDYLIEQGQSGVFGKAVMFGFEIGAVLSTLSPLVSSLGVLGQLASHVGSALAYVFGALVSNFGMSMFTDGYVFAYSQVEQASIAYNAVGDAVREAATNGFSSAAYAGVASVVKRVVSSAYAVGLVVMGTMYMIKYVFGKLMGPFMRRHPVAGPILVRTGAFAIEMVGALFIGPYIYQRMQGKDTGLFSQVNPASPGQQSGIVEADNLTKQMVLQDYKRRTGVDAPPDMFIDREMGANVRVINNAREIEAGGRAFEDVITTVEASSSVQASISLIFNVGNISPDDPHLGPVHDFLTESGSCPVGGSQAECLSNWRDAVQSSVRGEGGEELFQHFDQ